MAARSRNTEVEKQVFRACEYGDLETVQRLVPHVVGTEIRDYSWFEYTPLHHAARRGHLFICQFLITAKAEVNSKDGDGQTPLHDASLYGHLSICQVLIAANADRNSKDKLLASSNGYLEQLDVRDVTRLCIPEK